MLEDLKEVYFVKVAWDVILEKKATKVEVLREVCINGLLIAHHDQSLSDSCSVGKTTAQDVLSQLLGY